MTIYLYAIALASLLMLLVILVSAGLGYLIDSCPSIDAAVDWILLGFA